MKCNVGRAIILYIINMYLHTSRKKYYLEKFETIKFYIEYNTCTVSGQKYSDKMIFYYIFHIKPQFLKTLFQSQFLFDFDEIFTNGSERVRSFLWLFFGSTDFKCSWFKHKLKLFVFKCTIIVLYFWHSKFCFVFKLWTHKNYRL